MLNNFDVNQLVVMIVPLLLAVTIHEVAHGYVAYRQGDPTAKLAGRLTLNPVKHLDFIGSFLLPLVLKFSGSPIIFGYAKPVPVNPRNYRHYRRGDIIVSSAGIVVNLALAVLCVGLAVALGLVGEAVGAGRGVLVVLQRMTLWGIWLNLLLAFFNVLPIPPLDGSHIFYHLLPAPAGAKYRELSRYGFLPLLVLFFVFPGAIWRLLTPAVVLFRAAVDVVGPHALGPLPF